MAVLFTDTFTGNDEDLLTTYDASAWATITGLENGAKILSNAVAQNENNVTDGNRNTEVSWPDDQYSQVKVLPTNNDTINIGVRCSDSAYTCYSAGWNNGEYGNRYYRIEKIVNKSVTSLTASTQLPSANDIIYLGATGTALELKRNGGQLLTTTDAAIASGQPSLVARAAEDTGIFDDFEGGSIVSAPTFIPKVIIIN